MRHHALTLLLLGTPLLGACGEQATPPAVPPIETPDEELERLAVGLGDAFCEVQARCFTPVWLASRIGGEGCGAELERSFVDSQLPQWREALAAGQVTFEAAQIEPCLAAFRAAPCGDLDLQPAACDALFDGHQALGASCVHDIECQDGLFCDTAGACPGVCASPRDEGEACEATSGCRRGLTCSAEQRCEVIGRLGDPCRTVQECSDGLHCQGGYQEDVDGECVPFADRFSGALDEPCSLRDALCAEPLSCVLTGFEVGQELYACRAPVDGEEACLVGEPNLCPATRYCSADLRSDNVEGFCIPRPGSGGACDTHFPAVPCADGLSCVRSICLARRRLDEGCQFDAECYSFHCEGGRCVEPGSCRP